VILINLLTAGQRAPWNQLVHVGVTGVVRNVFIFQTRPCRAGDNFARLRLNIAEADFLVFFIQRQMRVVAAGILAQRCPGFHRHLTVGFRCQRQDDFGCINRGVDHRLAFRRAIRFGVVQFFQQIDFAVGIPANAFTAVTEFFQQRTDGSETLIGVRIITFNGHQMRGGAPRDQLTFAFFPVFHTKRLRQFSGGIMLDRQRHHIGFDTQMADAYAGEFFGDTFVDFPVTF